MIGVQQKQLMNIVQQALTEDIGEGDITSNSIIPIDAHFEGDFIAKEEGVIAGLEIVKLTFHSINDNIRFLPYVKDGQTIPQGEIIASVSGPGRSILSAERIALNFLQRMSGIATITRRFADAVHGTSTKILDTRKTIPGLRTLDKWAVRLGGGYNHRFGLYDMALIKENHIIAAGSIPEAVKRVRQKISHEIAIEVEVRNLEELKEALGLEIDRILLDNMSIKDLKSAVKVTEGKIPLEASGNINLDNVKVIAETGVDYVSVGMLTHSVKALDISLILK